VSAWELKTDRNTKGQYEMSEEKRRKAAVYVAGMALQGTPGLPNNDALREVLECLGLDDVGVR
jgi:hypothetical protein